MKERIAKRMAALGLCSRREAERWIEEGRVAVNNAVLTTPATLVDSTDSIAIDGEIIAQPRNQLPRLFLYYKPTGLVTSHRDEKNRPTVFDTLPRDLPRLISVGRLDINSEGLLLLTTSGTLSRAMELPKNALKRSYRVRVNGELSERNRALLAKGIAVDGVRYQPIAVEIEKTKTEGRNRWLHVTLTEGKNREIRRVFTHLTLPVSRLIRIRYGAFTLGTLTPGTMEEVPPRQVQALMNTLGIA